MPEPFKNLFNPSMIRVMAGHLKRCAPAFDAADFIATATNGLAGLELKQRSGQIQAALEKTLPAAFDDAAILRASLHPEDDVDLSGTDMDDRGIRGWAVIPMADYVAARGLADYDKAMALLREMTKRATAELAIRTFILHDPDRALAILDEWAGDPNFHIRRLVSEGSRPRLPWAMRLPCFIDDPDPLFALLTRLKDDPVEYVRRSVANNLNDIAKDHPDRVAAIARDWLVNAPPARQKLVRHACRTLIKAGHPATLDALGYGKPNVVLENLDLQTPVVVYGETLGFEVSLRSTAATDQDLIVDYVIHHQKANGTTRPKVFKWKTLTLKADAHHRARRRHAIKPITTRKYYAGTHRIEIKINGETFGGADFELDMAPPPSPSV